MSITRLLIGKDVNGAFTYELPFSNTNYTTFLTAGAAQSLTVPLGAEIAFFSCSGDFYVNNTTTAALPGGAFVASNSILNPVARDVTNTTTLSFVGVENCYLQVSFYRQSNSSETGLN